jgi:hypothetical protein
MRTSPRPFIAQLHRKHKRSTLILWTRHYSSMESAIKRAVGLAITEGFPGDVVEFSHSDLGYQVATVTLATRGKLTIDWSPLEAAERAIKHEARSAGQTKRQLAARMH